jgi:hypothetical protein
MNKKRIYIGIILFVFILGITYIARSSLEVRFEPSIDSNSVSSCGLLTHEDGKNDNDCVIYSWANYNWQKYEEEIINPAVPFNLERIYYRLARCMENIGFHRPLDGLPTNHVTDYHLIKCKKEIMKRDYGIDEKISYHSSQAGQGPFVGKCPRPGEYFILRMVNVNEFVGHNAKCEINGFCNSNTGQANVKCHEKWGTWTGSISFNGHITSTNTPDILSGASVIGYYQ